MHSIAHILLGVDEFLAHGNDDFHTFGKVVEGVFTLVVGLSRKFARNELRGQVGVNGNLRSGIQLALVVVIQDDTLGQHASLVHRDRLDDIAHARHITLALFGKSHLRMNGGVTILGNLEAVVAQGTLFPHGTAQGVAHNRLVVGHGIDCRTGKSCSGMVVHHHDGNVAFGLCIVVGVGDGAIASCKQGSRSN